MISRHVTTCPARRHAAPLSSLPNCERAERSKRLSRDPRRFREIFRQGANGIHLYLRDGADGIDIRARMFAPLLGVPEDPATGSANAALAGLLASLRPEPDLALDLRIAQGIEMGRPSLLEASAEKRGGKVAEIRLGGRCVAVMNGTIEI